MSQHDNYTSLQLFEHVRTVTGSSRNYLLRLLLQKKDSKEYIEELLNAHDKLSINVLRLLSPLDVSRFAETLAKLLNEGDLYTKRIIISRVGNNNDRSLVAALLKMALDNREDAFIRKTAITALGNSNDNNVVLPLIHAFDEMDDDGKSEILIALGKIGNKEAIPLFQKALQKESGDIRSTAERILQRLNNQEKTESEKKSAHNIDDFSIYKIWTRDPLSYPDTSHLCFFRNRKGNYEELKAGERELNVRFTFRVEKDMIVFITGQGREDRSGYSIKEGLIKHPYHGKLKCQVLQFTNPDISIKKISITGSGYYYLYQDI